MRIANIFSDALSSDKFLEFNTDQNFLQGLDNDLESISKYKDAIKDGVNESEAFNTHMATASSAASQYVKSMDASSLSTEQFAESQRMWQVQLSAGDKSLGNVKTLMNEYNSALDKTNQGMTKCGLSQQKFVDAVSKSNLGFGSYLNSLNGAQASMGGYVKYLAAGVAKTVAMRAATMALNMAITMAASALLGFAISLAANALDGLYESFEEVTERAKDSKRTFEDTASEIDDLKNQIKDLDGQIGEMESISTTDPKDLENLKQQKELLEAQVKIKEEINSYSGEKAARDAIDVLEKERGVKKEVTQKHQYGVNGEQSYDTTKEMNVAMNLIDETRYKQDKLNKTTRDYNELLIEHSKNSKASPLWEKEEKQLEKYEKEIANYKGEIADNLSIIGEQEETLRAVGGHEDKLSEIQKVYDDMQDNVEEIKTAEKIAEGMDIDLSEVLGDDSTNFTSKIDDYIVKTNELDDALSKLQSGDLSDSEISQLVKDFPELAGQTDNLDEAISNLQNDLSKDALIDFNSQMENVKTDGGVAAMQKLKESILGVGEAAVDTSSMMEGLKTSSEQYANIQKALTESNSATGLTYENFVALDGMFSNLDGYDQSALFERTATGIRLNSDELSRLNDLYAQNQAQEYSDTLVQLNQELALAQEQRDKYAEFKDSTDEADAAKRELYETYDDSVVSIQNQIAEVQNMASAWQGVTNAYNEYLMAQSSGNEKDSLEGVAKAKDEIKKSIDAGWTDTDDVNSYFDLVLGKDRPQDANEAWKQLHETIDGTTNSLATYLEKDDAGNLKSSAVTAWYNDISKVAGEGFAKIEEDGSKSLDLTGNKAEILAQKFGTTTEYVTLLAQALSETGVNVDFGNLTSGADQAANAAEKVKMSVETARKELSVLQEAGKIDSAIDLDIDVNTASTEKLKSTLEGLDKVKIDAEVDPAGYAALEKLKAEVQKEYLIRINVETGGEIESAQNKIEAIKKLVGNDGIKVALKGDNGDQIRQKIDELQNMSKKAKVAIGFDVKKGDYEGALSKIKNKKISVPAEIKWDKKDPEIKDKTAKVTFKKDTSDVDGYKPKDKEAKVKFKKDSNIPDGYKPKDKSATVKYKKDSSVPDGYQPKNKSATVTYHIKTEGSPPGKKAMGTMHFPTVAHKDGTMHNVLNWKSAYANGRVALDKDEEALVNELGTESLILLCHFM